MNQQNQKLFASFFEEVTNTFGLTLENLDQNTSGNVLCLRVGFLAFKKFFYSLFTNLVWVQSGIQINIVMRNVYALIRMILFAGAFALFSNIGHAQTLGGLPDLTFNVADTFGSVVPLNRNNLVFLPGPDGGVYGSLYEKYRVFNTDKNKLQFFPDYYDRQSKSNYNATHFITDALRSGELLQASSGVVYKVSNWFSSQGTGNPNSLFGIGVDSLLISKFNTSKLTPNLSNCFYFRKPYLGQYKTGIVKTTPNRLAFWLTYNPLDTLLGDQRHNHTYVRSLDTSCAPLAASIDLPNFRAVKSAVYQGNIYLIGTDESVSPFPSTKIVVLNGATLQPISISFPGLNINLLVFDNALQIFNILPNGKMLIAGRFNTQPFLERIIRLNADGSEDNSFAASVFSNQPTKWDLDAQGVVRAATIVTVGNQSVARFGVVGTNGGIQFSDVQINPGFAGGQPVMYHPDYNAFLFQTKQLSSNQTWRTPLQTGDVYPDTTSGKRHRFYVGLNGSTWPLVNVAGVGFFGETTKVDVNPTSDSKFLAYGNFTQVNQKVMPGLAMFKPNGDLDTNFRSTINLPDDSLKISIMKGLDHTAFLTNSGKVLIAGIAIRNWISYQGRSAFMDTIRRLNADGTKDLTYQGQWYHGSLRRLKNGNYCSVRFYENGVPSAVPNPGFGTMVKILILNPEGEFIRELGAYTSDGNYPDTSDMALRYMDVYFEDEAKGIWVKTDFTTYFANPWRNITYFIRFDSTGATSRFRTNFELLTTPLKVDILAGNRMRWTGAFGLADTTVFGKIVNVIETDAQGRVDMNVTPTKYFVQDRFGSRYNFYAAPYRYLPDGKILSFLNVYPGNIGLSLFRMRADGRQDNSFLPVSGSIWQSNIDVIGDRLLLGTMNFNWARYQYTQRLSYVNNSFKNGLHAFSLNATPANTGYAQGRVTQVVSPATGCNPGVTQKSARGMVIRSAPSGRFALTDTAGFYVIPLEVGNHNVKQTIANNFLQRQVCPVQANTGHDFEITAGGATSFGNNFINQTFDCPRLDLKITQPRFRLCSRTSFSIEYANDGVAPQPNARIRLNLPEEIKILSASKPFIKDTDSSYVFDLGTLQPGQHGSITTIDTIACPVTPDSLARACFSARIEPLSLCSNINPASINWDGSWLDAVARYIPATNKVRVVVYNKGASMTDSTSMRLTAPGLVYKDGNIQLAANDSLVFLCEPAIQGSIQLQLQQPEACPLGSNSRLNHSGRGTARAFLNFGTGLLETYTVQACPVWRFSYDPNEKVVEPSGEVEPGTDFDYTIHFENFGNDTAYFVAVVDSLPSQLDVSTIRLGASSHPYTLQVAGTEQNPILTFIFNPIKLTGKREDSVLSKGQLSFKISMKEGVNRGEVVSNRAHIYFDRNPAVITEFVHSKVRELGTLVTSTTTTISRENRMIVAPNPSAGMARIWFTQNDRPQRTILVSTMEGKLIKRLTYNGSILEIKDLPVGLYIISTEGLKPQRLVVGK